MLFCKIHKYYLGTHPEASYLKELFAPIAGELKIPVVSDLPEGVQVAARSGESGDLPGYC